MRIELKGMVISPGVAFGKVVLLDRYKTVVEKRRLSPASIESEKQRFLSAVEKSKEQIMTIKEALDPKQAGDHLQILNFNIMMLEDEILCEEVARTIENEQVNAEWAIASALSKKSEAFKNVEDIYMKERLADIYYLGERVLRNLRGVQDEIPDLDEYSVLVAHDISPVDLVGFAKHHAIGLATDVGGSTSHSAIVSKSLGIPAVMGLENVSLRVSPGDSIFVDGFKGIVIIDPTQKELREFTKRRKEYQALEKKLTGYATLPGRTLDGREIRVSANIEISDEADLAICYGAEGIGMYRTEFLFTSSVYFPTEDEQFEDYKKLISRFHLPHITIRTLDIGGDKFRTGVEPSKTLNPALGLRGIRFSLKDEKTFRTQIRAIIRASEYGKVRILVPMITTILEIREVKKIIREISRELNSTISPEIGVMIEIPSAAILASEMAEEVDFLSIGTNDLIQYTLAVDRVNDHVSYLFTPFNPAVLRLIKGVIEMGRAKGVSVSVCGEMAGQLSCVPLLVGMGVDELSMNVHAIPKVKKILNSITEDESKEILDHVLRLRTAPDIKEYVTRAIMEKWAGVIPCEFLQDMASD